MRMGCYGSKIQRTRQEKKPNHDKQNSGSICSEQCPQLLLRDKQNNNDEGRFIKQSIINVFFKAPTNHLVSDQRLYPNTQNNDQETHHQYPLSYRQKNKQLFSGLQTSFSGISDQQQHQSSCCPLTFQPSSASHAINISTPLNEITQNDSNLQHLHPAIQKKLDVPIVPFDQESLTLHPHDRLTGDLTTNQTIVQRHTESFSWNHVLARMKSILNRVQSGSLRNLKRPASSTEFIKTYTRHPLEADVKRNYSHLKYEEGITWKLDQKNDTKRVLPFLIEDDKKDTTQLQSALLHLPVCLQRRPFLDVYELGRTLGRGSFGEVRACYHRHTRRKFAVKIMQKFPDKALRGSNNVNFSAMFCNEVNVLAALHHPNIVTLHEAFEGKETLYAVIELCDSGDLFRYILKCVREQRQKRKLYLEYLRTMESTQNELLTKNRHKSSYHLYTTQQHIISEPNLSGPLTETQLSLFARSMLHTLQYLHSRRCVHRDIKAQNFLFSSQPYPGYDSYCKRKEKMISPVSTSISSSHQLCLTHIHSKEINQTYPLKMEQVSVDHVAPHFKSNYSQHIDTIQDKDCFQHDVISTLPSTTIIHTQLQTEDCHQAKDVWCPKSKYGIPNIHHSQNLSVDSKIHLTPTTTTTTPHTMHSTTSSHYSSISPILHDKKNKSFVTDPLKLSQHIPYVSTTNTLVSHSNDSYHNQSIISESSVETKKKHEIINNGTEKRLILIDFGMSACVPDGVYLKMLCGSPHYVAPEILLQKYGLEVDVWAFGVIMYLLVYGKYPFDGPDRTTILRKIHRSYPVFPITSFGPSPLILDFLKRCLTKDPATRMTASAALQHPWLISGGPNDNFRYPLISLPSHLMKDQQACAPQRTRPAGLVNAEKDVES